MLGADSKSAAVLPSWTVPLRAIRVSRASRQGAVAQLLTAQRRITLAHSAAQPEFSLVSVVRSRLARPKAIAARTRRRLERLERAFESTAFRMCKTARLPSTKAMA